MYQIANNDSSNQDYYKYTKIKEIVFALAATSAWSKEYKCKYIRALIR